MGELGIIVIQGTLTVDLKAIRDIEWSSSSYMGRGTFFISGTVNFKYGVAVLLMI